MYSDTNISQPGMNQEKFDQIYSYELTPLQHKVISLFLAGLKDPEIAKEMGKTHPTTATHHLRNISEKFGFPPETEPDFRCNLVEIFAKYKPVLVTAKALVDCGYIIHHSLRYPDNPEPLNSRFYQERPLVESRCYRDIQEPGVLIRVKAPSQMGKTSLLWRIKAQAESKSYGFRTVYLNFSSIETNKLESITKFLRSFYASVLTKLPSAPPLCAWDRNTPVMISCTEQFQNLLKQLDGVLVLILDEVDRLFEYSEISNNFFAMLRNWNENASESETWEKLRLVVAHSTEDYGQLDINRSPFNTGIPIKLEEFTEEQVRNLVLRYQVDSRNTKPIMSLVGGHPYLVRLALYYLVRHDLTIEQLREKAFTEIFIDHLQKHLSVLQENQELAILLQQIVTTDKVVKIEGKTKQMYYLESMGLIKVENNTIQPRCWLYREYFRDCLSSS